VTAATLVAQLREHGHQIRLDGPQIVIRPRPDAETIERLRESRDEIVAYLRERCAVDAPPVPHADALTEAAGLVAAEVAQLLQIRYGTAKPEIGAVGWTPDGKMCRRCYRIAIVRRCDFVCADCLPDGATR